MRIASTYLIKILHRSAVCVSVIVTMVFTWLLFVASTYPQNGELTVVSSSQGVPAEMTASEMKRVFKGERQRWKDGTKVVIALMKTTTPIGGYTSKKIYQMSGLELNKYWLGLVFQGKAKAPKFFTSESDLKSYVADTPGAIGIINSASVGDAKAVLIDGNKSF